MSLPLFTDALAALFIGGCMGVWQIDSQYVAYRSDVTFAQYYWTNVYHWQQADDVAPDNTIVNGYQQVMRESVPGYVTWLGYRITSPLGVVIWPGSVISVPGSGPWSGMLAPLINVVLMDFLSGGVRVGYKRFRGQWDDSLMLGDVWDASVTGWFRHVVGPKILTLSPVTSRGIVIDGFAVRDTIHMWQMRHGTKRGARPVFVQP